jgi:hypothetical protein
MYIPQGPLPNHSNLSDEVFVVKLFLEKKKGKFEPIPELIATNALFVRQPPGFLAEKAIKMININLI